MRDPLDALANIGSLPAVPAILETQERLTGMRAGAVACLVGGVWQVCAARDGIAIGIATGAVNSLVGALGARCLDQRRPVSMGALGHEGAPFRAQG